LSIRVEKPQLLVKELIKMTFRNAIPTSRKTHIGISKTQRLRKPERQSKFVWQRGRNQSLWLIKYEGWNF